jgi:uncharacterized protein YwqG
LHDVIGVLVAAAMLLLFAVVFGWVAWQAVQLFLDVFARRPRQVDAEASRLAAGRIRGRMTRMARETLLLAPAKAPGFSKLGGDPELPETAAWPAGARSFLAQIDLATFRQHAGPDWLPTNGRLYAFCDETRYGWVDLVTVLYCQDPPGPPRLLTATARRFHERRVAFVPMRSIPSTDWLGVDLSGLNDNDLDGLAGLHDEPFGDEIQHRIGGYPSEIQGGQMQIECELARRGIQANRETKITPAIRRAANHWRLLLQIDSDPALEMNWGDGGRLYLFVREGDARRGDFSKTVALAQTY